MEPENRVKPIPRKPFSGLSRERLSSSHPDLLRSAAFAEASYLLAYYGDDALSGLAVYFEAIAEDFRVRVRRRDQASKLAAAEVLEDLRVRYPHIHPQPNQQAQFKKEKPNER